MPKDKDYLEALKQEILNDTKDIEVWTELYDIVTNKDEE